jgi:hypothetical protein
MRTDAATETLFPRFSHEGFFTRFYRGSRHSYNIRKQGRAATTSSRACDYNRASWPNSASPIAGDDEEMTSCSRRLQLRGCVRLKAPITVRDLVR